MRFLRGHDRKLNEHNYPKLFYPELYLLEGGYKNFYEKYKVSHLVMGNKVENFSFKIFFFLFKIELLRTTRIQTNATRAAY